MSWPTISRKRKSRRATRVSAAQGLVEARQVGCCAEATDVHAKRPDDDSPSGEQPFTDGLPAMSSRGAAKFLVAGGKRMRERRRLSHEARLHAVDGAEGGCDLGAEMQHRERVLERLLRSSQGGGRTRTDGTRCEPG